MVADARFCQTVLPPLIYDMYGHRCVYDSRGNFLGFQGYKSKGRDWQEFFVDVLAR